MSLKTKIIKKKDFIYMVELNGSLDSETYQGLEEELNEVINEKTKALILDMKTLTYVSSAGIRVILSTEKLLKKKEMNLTRICGYLS